MVSARTKKSKSGSLLKRKKLLGITSESGSSNVKTLAALSLGAVALISSGVSTVNATESAYKPPEKPTQVAEKAKPVQKESVKRDVLPLKKVSKVESQSPLITVDDREQEARYLEWLEVKAIDPANQRGSTPPYTELVPDNPEDYVLSYVPYKDSTLIAVRAPAGTYEGVKKEAMRKYRNSLKSRAAVEERKRLVASMTPAMKAAMIEDEVHRAIDTGYAASLPPWEDLGEKPSVVVVTEEPSPHLIEAMALAHRALVEKHVSLKRMAIRTKVVDRSEQLERELSVKKTDSNVKHLSAETNERVRLLVEENIPLQDQDEHLKAISDGKKYDDLLIKALENDAAIVDSVKAMANGGVIEDEQPSWEEINRLGLEEYVETPTENYLQQSVDTFWDNVYKYNSMGVMYPDLRAGSLLFSDDSLEYYRHLFIKLNGKANTDITFFSEMMKAYHKEYDAYRAWLEDNTFYQRKNIVETLDDVKYYSRLAEFDNDLEGAFMIEELGHQSDELRYNAHWDSLKQQVLSLEASELPKRVESLHPKRKSKVILINPPVVEAVSPTVVYNYIMKDFESSRSVPDFDWIGRVTSGFASRNWNAVSSEFKLDEDSGLLMPNYAF